MLSSVLRIVGICLAIQSLLFANRVGDFCPIHVGATWRYIGSESSQARTTVYSYSIARTIIVQGKITNGDTHQYPISIRDSIFEAVGHRSDTVLSYTADLVEFPDSTLKISSQDSMLIELFRTRFYEDSLVADGYFDGAARKVFRDSSKYEESTVPGFESVVTKFQNVGISRYAANSFFLPLPYWKKTGFELVSFTTTPPHMLGTVRKRPEPPGQRLRRNGVDVLGRIKAVTGRWMKRF